MNNKGFTLIELIATIVVLGIVASIGTYAIINTINSTKDQNYNNLVKNIKDAADAYYMECKYSAPTTASAGYTCTMSGSDYTVTLLQLVERGFITGNAKDNAGKYKIINPKNDIDLGCCKIKITYSTGGNVTVTNVTPDSCSSRAHCPKNADYGS